MLATRRTVLFLAITLSGCAAHIAPSGPDVPDQLYDEIHGAGARDTVRLLQEGMRERQVYGTTEPYIPIRKPADVREIWVPDHRDQATGRLVHGHWESTVLREGEWYTD